MNTIQQLKQDAISKGICSRWQSKFKDEMSLKRLVRMYVKGIDFCISEDYPTLAFLRTEMKGKCEPYGVFIDDIVQWHNASDVVLNGTCKAELKYNEYSVSRLYVRHDSTADVIVSGNALVTIDAFDNSVLNVVASEKCKVVIAQYGNSKVNIKQGLENVSVKFMNKKTY